MSNETASQSRNRTDTPRTDAKAGFANFDDAMKGGPGNVVPADFARELERELAEAKEHAEYEQNRADGAVEELKSALSATAAIKRDEAIGMFCGIATALEVEDFNLTERMRLALHQFANDCLKFRSSDRSSQ